MLLLLVMEEEKGSEWNGTELDGTRNTYSSTSFAPLRTLLLRRLKLYFIGPNSQI